MKLTCITPTRTLNKAYLKESIQREDIERFKGNLITLFERIKPGESEEHLKNILADFLKDTWYKPAYEINTSGRADPAVGSGHFLVSALNEIIAIKSELGILSDRDGKRLRDYVVTVENDELIIACEDQLFAYNPKDSESRRMQETLFFEKATIIENCLFGVDINPKSVAICRLRLWIELLKNAYYTKESGYSELETLPNIDINIKCGNSLVSRFALTGAPNVLPADRKKLKELTERYRRHVFDYKLSPANKAQLRKVIDNLKEDLQNFGLPNDKDMIALRRKKNELSQLPLFALSANEAAAQQKMQQEVDALERRFEEKQRSTYFNAFEWRFEFPEVLDENGDFLGFDAVIGNPPYIRQEAIKEQKGAFAERFGSFYCGTADIYTYFYKIGVEILHPAGLLCYIAPNKFMRAGYGKNTRELLTSQAVPLLVFDFGDLPVFEEATTYPSIVLVAKSSPSPTLPLRGRELKPQPSKTVIVNSSPQRGEVGRRELETDKTLFIPTRVPPALLEAARSLRGNLTDAEALLWRFLRNKQLGGYRFRRQHPVERFVLDFYCCETKLAVELDGGQHNEPDSRLRDAERTDFLAGLGIQVIRYWNTEVFSNLEGVLETIYLALQDRSPLPNPPPLGEGVEITNLPTDDALQIKPLPPAGGGREGGVFLAATFTEPQQLTCFAENIPTIGFTMPVSALKVEGWNLERPAVLALMEKLSQFGTLLGEYVGGEIYYGIKTGLNEAFVIDEETKNRLIHEDARSTELIKPWLRGRDVKKWRAEWAGLYVIAIASSANWNWPWSQESSEEAASFVFAREYPAIFQHLSQRAESLRKRDDQGRFWWELRSCAYYVEFEKPKIMYAEISTEGRFLLESNGYYSDTTTYIISNNSEWLLAVLNSKLFTYMFSFVGSAISGGFLRWKRQYMEQLPIPPASVEQKRAIIDLVEQILAISAPSPTLPLRGRELNAQLELAKMESRLSSSTQRGEAGRGEEQQHLLESQIDALVYQLYGLTPEEIAIVEQGKN